VWILAETFEEAVERVTQKGMQRRPIFFPILHFFRVFVGLQLYWMQTALNPSKWPPCGVLAAEEKDQERGQTDQDAHSHYQRGPPRRTGELDGWTYIVDHVKFVAVTTA
jgi:hypothetical protein